MRRAFFRAFTNPADERLRRLAAVAGPALMLASVLYALAGGATLAEILDITVVYGTFLVAGLIAWSRRPTNRVGPALVATGMCLMLPPLAAPPWLVLAPIGIAGAAAGTALIGYLILAFPTGDLRPPASRYALVGLGALLFVVRAANFTAVDPAARGWNALNPYRLIHDRDVAALIEKVMLVTTILIIVTLLVLFVVRWQRASRPARRALTPVLVAGIAIAAIYVSALGASLGDMPATLRSVVLWTKDISLALFPIGFLAGFLRIHLARSAIADLVVELGETPTPERIQDALARALGDPTLAVVHWSIADATYLDACGDATELPAEGSDRAVTMLEREGLPIAAIVHDPALLDDPGLVASMVSALRLAVDNERLQAEVETQLEEVQASRARIVEAGDAERRRLERDLHDGAQQRLVSLTLAIRLARTKLGEGGDPAVRQSLEQAADDARLALVELRELARGIHPAILAEAGLGAAVESLADRSIIPAIVECTTGERHPPTVESTAYFVVSEALANVNKHASATRATIRIGRTDGHLSVEIADDGVGGADARLGSGLRGLTDRLAAVGGTLEVESPTGVGTRLLARIPVDPQPPIPG